MKRVLRWTVHEYFTILSIYQPRSGGNHEITMPQFFLSFPLHFLGFAAHIFPTVPRLAFLVSCLRQQRLFFSTCSAVSAADAQSQQLAGEELGLIVAVRLRLRYIFRKINSKFFFLTLAQYSCDLQAFPLNSVMHLSRNSWKKLSRYKTFAFWAATCCRELLWYFSSPLFKCEALFSLARNWSCDPIRPPFVDV